MQLQTIQRPMWEKGGNHLWLVRKNTKNTSCILSMAFLRYAVRQSSSPMGNLPTPCYRCRRKRGRSFTFTFSGIIHSGKSGKYTGMEKVRYGTTCTVPCRCCRRKWRCFYMGNSNFVPYETIVRATSGEPEAVDEVLRHYGKQIRLAALENGHVNQDTEDSIKRRLIIALFQFRFDEQPYLKTE